MDYQLTFKKIFSSQYLFTGIRITAAAIIPAFILYHYNVLGLMAAIPLGALVVGSTDSPGPFTHRRNAILASICLNFIVVVITMSLQHNAILILIFIVLFGMFFSLIGIYGNRANSVGLIALLVFTFNIDSKASFESAWYNGLLFTAGGACYLIMSLILHRLRPYRYIQLQLGESLRTISNYTETLADLFKINRDEDYTYTRLRQQQITIQQEQDSLREMLLSTREMVIDSTVKGRILMMMFLDSVDLFEQLLSLQQDYTSIHKEFDNTEMMDAMLETLNSFQQELNSVGYAIQFNQPSNPETDISAVTKKLFDVYLAERKKNLNKNTLSLFIKLRQVIYALQDVGERIKRLHHFSRYKKMTAKAFRQNANEEVQIKSTEISPVLLIENITLKSSQFRHALRVTTGMLIGYCISLFFPLGHGYWIIMTIAIILKPAYSISRTRNKQRLLGTLTGVTLTFLFLYFIKSNTVEFLLLTCAMIIAYSLLKVNYFISVICITIYVLISFHFLNNSNFTVIIKDRLIDTVIGCTISFIVSLIVFPVWEHQQIKDLMKALVDANKNYFNAGASLLKRTTEQEDLYKAARKQAFVALANLSDNFQRVLSEKRRTNEVAFYHQFVSSSYMLTAHIASLSALIKRYDDNLKDSDLNPLVININNKFKRADCVLNGELLKTSVSNRNAPIINKIQTLLLQRQKEIEEGKSDMQTQARSMLSSFKAVTDEFEIIDSIVDDEVKILQRIIK